MEWVAIFLGIFLGISLAAPPGPMNALIAREASRHGTSHGIRVGMGAPVADVVYLAVLWFGLRSVLDEPGWIRGAAALGSIVMTYFAYQTWFPPEAQTAARPRPATFMAGFLAAMTNPYQLAWWLSGGFVFLQAQGVWGISGLLFGIFGWVVLFSWLVAHGAQRWTWFTPATRIVSAAVLTVFAGLLLAVALSIIVV